MRVQNFNRLAVDYAKMLRFGLDNRVMLENFIWQDGCHSPDRRNWFQRLTTDEDKSIVLCRQQKEAWVICLLKQDPVKFAKKGSVIDGSVDPYRLLLKHRDQLRFADRVLQFISESSLQSVHDSYIRFLEHCVVANGSRVMLIPSLIEDFGWHSHMMDHANYVKDTTAWFGSILHHDTTTKITKERRKDSDDLRTQLAFASIGAASIGVASIGTEKRNTSTSSTSSSDCVVTPPSVSSVSSVSSCSFTEADCSSCSSDSSCSSCSSCGGGD